MPSLEDIKGKVFEFGGNGYAQGNSSKSNSKTTDGGRDDETKDNELWKIKLKEHDLSFARGTICSEAEHDRTSIDQIFLGMMSAATNKPIGHTVNSRKAGVGKSYLLNKVASYFPYKYVRILAGASNKAFLHNEGTMVLKSENGDYVPVEPIIAEIEAEISELNTEIESEKIKEQKERDNELIRENKKIIQEKANEIKKLISSQCKLIDFSHIPIILAQDTFQDEFFQTLLSLVSQDSERDQEYTFVEQSGSGKFGARTNILTGTPVIFTTRVTDDTENKRFAEKNRRFINVTPNTSEAKNKAAIELMFKKYGSTPEEYDIQVVSRENKKRAKKIIEIIFEKLRHHSSLLDQKDRETGVKIYFWQSLHHAIPAEDPWSMTVTDRIIMYLSVYAKIRMDFRPRLVNKETGAFYIIPIFEDLRDTFDIMDRGGSNVRFYIAEWYEKVFVPAIKAMNGRPKEILQDGKPIGNESHVGLTSDDLAKLTNEGSKRIRDDFLYPLYNCGLVDCVRSDDDLREKLWFPVSDQDKAFSLFDSNKDKRLKISNPLFYPSLNVLEDFNRNSKIYDAERSIENKKNFSEIYSLQDCDGTKITEHELFTKYFSNPEICFIKDFSRYEQSIAAVSIRNIQYCSQIVRNQQEKNYFFTDPSPRHIFTEFSNKDTEESSILEGGRE